MKHLRMRMETIQILQSILKREDEEYKKLLHTIDQLDSFSNEIEEEEALESVFRGPSFRKKIKIRSYEEPYDDNSHSDSTWN